LEKLGINLGYLIVQIVNFAIIFITLRAWVYKPLVNMLDKRRATIAQGLEDARIAEAARSNAEKESDRIIKEAQIKAADVVREASERAEAVKREMQTVAEAEIVKSREASLAEIEQERTRLLGEMRSQVVALAIAAAHKLIGDALTRDEKQQHNLLQEFFSGVKAGKIVVLEGEQVSGTAAEVTSALPLSMDEQDSIKKNLLASLSGAAAVSFRVDPSILGGLIVHVGDRVIDGSVSGQLQGLRQSLQ
jgi:F-type H+-transporting ATPase subunit b